MCSFRLKVISLFLMMVLSAVLVFAQSGETNAENELAKAKMMVVQKDYPKAIEAYKHLYQTATNNTEIYQDYLQVLIAAKEYKEAERLIENQQKLRPQDVLLNIDLGSLYLTMGKEKKALSYFDVAISKLNGDDMLTTRMAAAFNKINRTDYAIKTYEKAIEILRYPYLYGNELSKLYAKVGAIEQAVSLLIEVGPRQIGTVEDTKAQLLEIVANNPKRLQQTQKILIKKINENPSNNFYSELLTWLYTQKNDWEGALLQIQAIDARNKDNGQRVLDFARLARKEKQYDIAIQAIEAIIEEGKEQPIYPIALAEKLEIGMIKLAEDINSSQQTITNLATSFETYFKDFPQNTSTETLLQYAKLEAQYNNNAAKAILLLEQAITQPSATKNFMGRAKLQLGDYYILQGKIWEASLTYSQVDKAFKEDMLGEEARFRNAKLAYYRGDFQWAEGQLSVLKASTSELIANDALQLSVLIIENIPPDSNLVPLRQFAHADLLLFQNKDMEAARVLDSIAKVYPKHPLMDDIYMLHAAIAIKHKDYKQALENYQIVITQFSNDVLADDATFKTAEIYELYLKQPEQAKHYFEELIIKFPGSTYIQTARMKIAESAAPL